MAELSHIREKNLFDKSTSYEGSTTKTNRATRERLDVAIANFWVDRTVLRKNEKPSKHIRTKIGEPPSPEEQARIKELNLPEGMYPAGAQIEGWSPLRDRTPWRIPSVTDTQQKVGLLPEWYLNIRSEVAVWLEIMRRIQPYIKLLEIRLPFPVYSLPALLVLIATAPLIPGPAIYNVLLAPILLLGGGIRWLDRVVAATQPMLWPIVNTLSAIAWAAKSVAYLLTGNGLAKLSYYSMFNVKSGGKRQ